MSAIDVTGHFRATALGRQGRIDEGLVEMQGVADGLATLVDAPASQNMLWARRLTGPGAALDGLSRST